MIPGISGKRKVASVKITQEVGKCIVYFNEKIVYLKIDYFRLF